MAIIIIGIIILVAGMLILKQKEEFNKLGKGIRAFGIVLIIIGALNACVKQIDAGQIGVTSLFGKVYFPRAIVPLSISASNLFQFAIKLVLLFE